MQHFGAIKLATNHFVSELLFFCLPLVSVLPSPPTSKKPPSIVPQDDNSCRTLNQNLFVGSLFSWQHVGFIIAIIIIVVVVVVVGDGGGVGTRKMLQEQTTG